MAQPSPSAVARGSRGAGRTGARCDTGPARRGRYVNVRGNGTATLAFGGTLTLGGQGTLRFKDAAGDASVSVTGPGVRADDGEGWTRYVGFAGTATLRGSSLEVVLAGGELRIEVDGTGTATFAGSWTCDLDDRGSPAEPPP